jgi:hypothetical protein
MELNEMLTKTHGSIIFNEALNNQLASLKSQKYLYNYSFLHRKILKDAHKLTMVKTLFSAGFYDSKLMTNNL